MTTKIVLVGFGIMGKAYAEKLVKNMTKWDAELIAIVDPRDAAFDLKGTRQEATLKDVLPYIKRYDDLETALAERKPDIVLNAANNEAHIEIIRSLGGHPNVDTYLTEKPLVGEDENLHEAEQRLRTLMVSMNMVTNFSRAAIGMKEWLAQHKELNLIGIDAVWGKDRRTDTRPTPGIVNDIVHPVGLVQSIFGATEWSLHSPAQGFYGLLSTDRDGRENNCVYHYKAAFNTNIAPVRMDASFGWREQARRVTAFLCDSAERDFYSVELFLDEKNSTDEKQRGDYFQVYALNDAFRPVKLVHRSEFTTADKIESFLERSLMVRDGKLPLQQAGLTGLKEDAVLSKVFGMLHPGADLAALKASPNLVIERRDVERADLSPAFTNIDYAPIAEIGDRVKALYEMRGFEMRPQPTQELKPRL